MSKHLEIGDLVSHNRISDSLGIIIDKQEEIERSCVEWLTGALAGRSYWYFNSYLNSKK